MKGLALVLGAIVMVVLCYMVGSRLSADAVGMAVGMVFGLLAGVPIAVILVMSSQSTHARYIDRPDSSPRLAEQPPVVLLPNGHAPYDRKVEW